jgi:6-phosphogluconolactonase (cycloisomerase 2 family)
VLVVKEVAMTLRPRCWCLLALLLAAIPAQAASSPASDLAVVDPTQRALFDDLFLEAVGPQRSFARDLLPGRADEHLAWFPQQYLVPFANSSAAAAPLPGYLIGSGTLHATPVTLGLAQGTGTAGAALSTSGNACYLAESGTNDIAAYSVDLVTSLFSNVAGAPFPAESGPSGIAAEPSGRFVYATNSTSQSVTVYAIDLATQALTRAGSISTTATQPRAINATRQCVFVANTGTGGYEAFAINGTTGALSGVPGSPFGTHQASSVVRTADGNFVYFSAISPAGRIEGFFVEPSCALTAVPGSPFAGPAGGVLRVNADNPVLYSAGSGSLQAYAIDPATGALSPIGYALTVDPDTGAMAVGPKSEFLWLSDLSNQNLRPVALDATTGALKTAEAPVTGPHGVQSMVVVNENGSQIIGHGKSQNRNDRVLGGAPPYTFALTGGALPAGLHLDSAGTISGTPTTLGESSFEVQVTDAVGATTTGVRALKVVVPPAAPAAPSNLAATVDSPTQVTLTWQDNANQTAGFQIDLSQDGGPSLEVQAVRPQATSAVISGLSPATAYTFSVRAQNAGGGATDTTTVAVTTTALAPPACTASATGQCLLGGRFLLQALYQDAQGDAGLANVVPITTDTAYLWFFNAANVEVVVKLIDGCALGGHYWVFAGGLTNVHVILRVTDTASGAVRYYEVPYGPAFTPIQDTSAFGTCTGAAAADADPGAALALRQSAVAEISSRLAAAAAAARPAAPVVPAIEQTGCTTSGQALCLENGRFKVQATFNAGASGSGTAQVGQLTSDTGYLWFFSSSNVEAVIKVLDGCGLNSRYWVFAGGLTNVEVTLTVTDLQTNQTRQYVNPANTTFEPIQDTSAFETCP